MVTEANLACFDHIPGATALYFVTRHSHTYKEANRAISEGSRSLRAIVTHSSAHDKRRQKRIDKEIAKGRKDLINTLAKRGKNAFFCLADADAECAFLRSLSAPYHSLETRVEEDITYAPGMILFLCLLIWNLMQRQMRQYLDKTNSTLEGLDRRKTNRPTPYMMTTKFRNVLILRSGQSRILKKPLSPVQRAYITALGLTEAIFVNAQPPPLTQINSPDTT